MTATSLPSAYRAKVLNETWTNFSVLRHGAFDGVLVTSKNSGTHWLKYMLAVALAKPWDRATGIFLRECGPAVHRLAEGCAGLPAAAASRFQPHDSAPAGGLGMGPRLAKLPPYVLAVRHPMSILASHHAKWEYDIKVDWLTYLEGDPAGSKYRCDLYWLARFWNRWGEVLASRRVHSRRSL
jgi:hypothetical protein